MLVDLQQLGTLLVAQTGPGGCGGDSLQTIPFLLMIPIFWFLVIGPARKERKEHDAMLDALKRGDEIVTQGGVLGTVADFEGTIVVLEVAKNVKLKVLRSAVLKRVDPEALKAKKEQEAKS